ncbi:arsenite-transporting ATPase [Acetoanaerobium pronyense]|uniref:Arsenite-transporting ATPase n=1 Tax=Acetoanaerobium pronyense TaxID=1482736 RepID=A0ABS4KLF5_9FIRM|nr:ArsA family ATPase [Acetoanaerobium pronyense]MBP2028056.1 arsenite-transporting ATPase [Acetoanaerobium pronyense]
MRIILYTGKGGVGKTSMAAATACKIAKSGKKVMIISTDQAHSLSDAFDMKIQREKTKVMDNLDAMEVDAIYEGEKSWGNLKDYIKEILTIRGEGGIEVEELLIFPGFEELFSLFKILDIYEEGKYDVLIVDCAPTGETLSLLKYPQRLSDLVSRVLPMKRKSVKVAGPAFEKITKMPMPKDGVFDDIEYVMERMQALQDLMQNKEILSIRIVTTPEKIVILESKRNFTCMYLYNYNVDAIIVNKIYPDEAMQGYFNKWIKMQKEGLNEINESFSEVPKFYVNLQNTELRTVKTLCTVGAEIFKKDNPENVLFSQEIYRYEKVEDSFIIYIYLPFAEKKELELNQTEGELILGIKNEVRRFPIPIEARSKEISSARFEDGYLQISYAPSN